MKNKAFEFEFSLSVCLFDCLSACLPACLSACLSVSLLHIVSSTTAKGKYLLLASALISKMYNVNMRMDVDALYVF